MHDGWTYATIGDVAKVVGGGTPKTKESSYWGGDVLWVTPTEITRQEGQVITTTDRTITQLGLEKSSANLLPPRTVLLTSRATIGAVAIAGVAMATNQGFASLVADESEVIPKFLMYWCQANRSEFEKRAGGNTFKEVSKANVSAVPIQLPPVKEQRRIVDLISSIDSAIQAGTVLENLPYRLWESHIGTETGGHAYLDLSEVLEAARAGGTPNREKTEYFGGNIPWLKSGEVANPQIRSAEEYLTKAGLVGSAAWVVPSAAVLVAMYGATAGEVGYLVEPMATNQAVLALIGKPGLVDQRFLYHWLRSRSARMKARATGAAQPNLSKARVLEEPFPDLPVEVQQSIAGRLDSVIGAATSASAVVESLRKLRSEVLNQLLSGSHEVPDSYDRFLEAAS